MCDYIEGCIPDELKRLFTFNYDSTTHFQLHITPTFLLLLPIEKQGKRIRWPLILLPFRWPFILLPYCIVGASTSATLELINHCIMLQCL